MLSLKSGSFIFNYVLYVFEKNRNLRSLSSESYTKRILEISLPIAFTSYIKSGLSTLKQVLIPSSLERSGLSCSVSLSKYGIINGMIMPIIMFPCVFIDSFSSLLMPEFSRYYAKKDYKRIRQVTKLILALTSIFSIFLTIIFFLFADDLALFIYKDIEISIYLKLLCPAILFIYIDIVIDSILKGLNEQVNVMFVNVIDLIVSVIFIYCFVPKLGFAGYILSVFISEILNFVLSGLRLCKVLKR